MKAVLYTALITLSLSSFAGELKNRKATGVNVKIPPVVTLKQTMPTVGVQRETPIQVDIGAQTGVAVPLLGASVDVGQLTVGPKQAHVQVGTTTGVKVGPLSVKQTLPSLSVGTDVNDDGLLDIGIKDGPKLTLPFIKLFIPWPKFGE